jgi:hypothetical protein
MLAIIAKASGGCLWQPAICLRRHPNESLTLVPDYCHSVAQSGAQ